MTGRGTLLLVGVLLGLLGYLWMAEVRPRRPAAPVSGPPPLLIVPPAMVAQVEVETHGVHLTAVRHDGTWGDADGRPWRADAVSDLVATLETLRPVMVVDLDPKEPGDYGLGPEAEHVRIIGTDGQPLLALEVGDRNPSWTGLYARRAGQPEVILVGAVLRWELEKLRGAAPSP